MTVLAGRGIPPHLLPITYTHRKRKKKLVTKATKSDIAHVFNSFLRTSSKTSSPSPLLPQSFYTTTAKEIPLTNIHLRMQHPTSRIVDLLFRFFELHRLNIIKLFIIDHKVFFLNRSFIFLSWFILGKM